MGKRLTLSLSAWTGFSILHSPLGGGAHLTESSNPNFAFVARSPRPRAHFSRALPAVTDRAIKTSRRFNPQGLVTFKMKFDPIARTSSGTVIVLFYDRQRRISSSLLDTFDVNEGGR